MEQERLFLAALESAKTFDVESGALYLRRNDGERAIHAAAER